MLPWLPIVAALSPFANQTPPAAETVQAPEKWTQAALDALSEEIGRQVEELRDMKYSKPVPVKITDQKGLVEYAKKREAETETPGRMKNDEVVAKLLGLIPADLDLEAKMMKVLEDQVGGFYDPGTKSFYIMESYTGGVAKIILAHELTHALDDQNFDIDATLAKCHDESDAELAFRCVVEGSGTAAMEEWRQRFGSDITMADLEKAGGSTENLEDAPPFVWKPLLASYLSGAAFLAAAPHGPEPAASTTEPESDKPNPDALKPPTKRAKASAHTDDPAAIRRAFRSPPRSTEQILHPKKYWDDAQRDDPVRIAIDTSKAPAGWKVEREDVMGELNLALLTTPLKERKGLSMMTVAFARYTNKAAEGWGGDRLVLLSRGDDRWIEFVTAWDTEKDADEFALALGDPKQPGVIPIFAGGTVETERTAEKGWRAGLTPTDARITRETGPDGKNSIVIVRVFSFAKPASEAEMQKLALPWRIDAAVK